MSHLYKRNNIYWLEFYINGKPHWKSLKTKDHSTAKYLQAKHDKEIVEGKYTTYEPNPSCDKILAEYEKAVVLYYQPGKRLSSINLWP